MYKKERYLYYFGGSLIYWKERFLFEDVLKKILKLNVLNWCLLKNYNKKF